MLKTLLFLIKLVFFSVAVLALGNWLRWDGKTISDQVKVGMSHAEDAHFFSDLQEWAKKVTDDARKGFQSKSKIRSKSPGILIPSSNAEEDISSTERQKLKALIRELNTSQNNE